MMSVIYSVVNIKLMCRYILVLTGNCLGNTTSLDYYSMCES